MRRYIFHFITFVVSLTVANSAFGEELPNPGRTDSNSTKTKLAAGKTYVLTNNLTPNYQCRWNIELDSDTKEVIVDLNGKIIDAKNIGRTVFNVVRGKLTIIDGKGGGKIINSTKSAIYVAPSTSSSNTKATCDFKGGTIENCQPSDANGGAFDIQPRGTVNMMGGTITKCLGTNGAAIYVKGGTFNMSGGCITENRVNAYKDWTPPTGNDEIPTCTSVPNVPTKGGGVFVEEKGTFTMTGGTISGNIANSGGGVFITEGSSFTFKGGIIDGNYAVATLGAGVGNGGGIYIVNSGGNSTCTIEGGVLQNNRATRYGGAVNINGGTVNVLKSSITGNVASSGGGIAMEVKGSILNLNGECEIMNNVAKVSGSDPNKDNGGGGGVFIYNGNINILSTSNSITSNRSYVRGGGILVNTGSIHISGSASFASNKATNDISGKAAYGGAIYLASGDIIVDANGILKVGGDASDDGNIAKNDGGGIYCAGTITVNGNSIFNNNRADNGGGAYVTNGNLSLNECIVTNNSSTNYGGAFYVTEGNIEFNHNATIKDNTAKQRGGAAYVYKGTIETASGYKTELSNNTVTGVTDGSAKYSGGAFYIKGEDASNKGHLKLKGETVMTKNSSVSNGGAIAVSNGDINITGPSILLEENHANNGGAFYVSSGNVTVDNTQGKLSMSSNCAENNGGAIFVKNGSFSTNGSISLFSNKANKENGGAIYVSNGNISTHAGTMSDNSAELGSGGVFFVDGGNINLGGKTTMSDNTAKNGGAIALKGGVFTIHSESEIWGNKASENGGGLWVENTTGAAIACKGGSFNNNTADGSGGGIYANGGAENKLKFVFAANVKNNMAQNGGGIYTDGVEMYFGNGLIVANKAGSMDVQGFANSGDIGVGGGIYMTNGTLQFVDASVEGNTVTTGNEALENLGIYNNDASYEAADIYVSGENTTIHLPYVKGMNLSGFDVPGSELYWVRDFNQWINNGISYPRYQKALLDMNVDIEKMIVGFSDNEMDAKVKEITNEIICLDLGYDLVYVTFTVEGLEAVDNAELQILYPKKGDKNDNVLYRRILFSGNGDTKIVGLPSGNWKFETSNLSYKYLIPTFTPSYAVSDDATTGTLAGYILFKRKQNDKVTVKFKPLDIGKGKVMEYDMKIINKMIPKQGGETTIVKPTATTL